MRLARNLSSSAVAQLPLRVVRRRQIEICRSVVPSQFRSFREESLQRGHRLVPKLDREAHVRASIIKFSSPPSRSRLSTRPFVFAGARRTLDQIVLKASDGSARAIVAGRTRKVIAGDASPRRHLHRQSHDLRCRARPCLDRSRSDRSAHTLASGSLIGVEEAASHLLHPKAVPGFARSQRSRRADSRGRSRRRRGIGPVRPCSVPRP
jgi:hypothetical protein